MMNINNDINNIEELINYFNLHPEEKEFYPQTINELKVWYIIHNLPDEETTRFFIGKNISTSLLAFGIYEDNNTYITYKNKRDGTRSIRYSGPNEAQAVSELFERLLDEIYNQKEQNYAERYQLKQSYPTHNFVETKSISPQSNGGIIDKIKKNIIAIIFYIICIIFFIGIIVVAYKTGFTGGGSSSYYYDNDDYYDDNDYYYNNDDDDDDDDYDYNWDDDDDWNSNDTDWDSDW